MTQPKQPIRVVLADDDAGMRLMLRKVLEGQAGFALLAEAEDGAELLKLVEEHHPQLVFLDVEMPNLDGVESARIIQDMDPAIILIFVTAHEQYMGDAFELYAFDYLLKPFKISRVLKTLGRVQEVLAKREDALRAQPVAPVKTAENKDRLMLKGREGVQVLDTLEILLIQREERSTVLYTGDGSRHVTAEPLGELEKRLDPKLFFRCHKSYIVNLNSIDNITPYGRWTYIAKLKGIRQDALITRAKYEELEEIFS